MFDDRKELLDHFISSYWNYFLELENEFANTQKYVAFDMRNKNTYSIEYLKLFQAVCSEIDVLGKEILLHFEPQFKTKGMVSIKHWGYGITQYMEDYLTTAVTFVDKSSFIPWKEFGCVKYQNEKKSICYKLKDNCSYPSWWSDYNKVKHERTTCGNDGFVNYQRANFWNLIQSLAALFVLEKSYMDILSQESEMHYYAEKSQLFKLQNVHSKIIGENNVLLSGTL